MFFFLLTVSKYQSAETGFNFDLILYLGLSGFKDQIDRVTFTKLITLTNRCRINLLTINAKGQACNCNFTQKEEITKFQWFCIVFYFLSGKTEKKKKNSWSKEKLHACRDTSGRHVDTTGLSIV